METVLSSRPIFGRRGSCLDIGEELALAKSSSLRLDDDERVEGISERACKDLDLAWNKQRVSGAGQGILAQEAVLLVTSVLLFLCMGRSVGTPLIYYIAAKEVQSRVKAGSVAVWPGL